MDFQKLASVVNKVLNAKEGVEFQSFIYDLQDRITRLTIERSDLEKTIMALKTEIANHASWEQEKEKYEIVDRVGAKVYSLKGTDEVFCPMCFNKHKMPIHIQPKVEGFKRSDESYCPNCKSVFPKLFS